MSEHTRCPYDPRELAGQPIGQLHCPECGCMVIAGWEHGVCVDNPECPYFDAGAAARLDEEYRQWALANAADPDGPQPHRIVFP